MDEQRIEEDGPGPPRNKEERAMRLELTTDEARELRNALALHLRGLQDELVHTDDRAYRAGLREGMSRLERIAARLAEPAFVEPLAP